MKKKYLYFQLKLMTLKKNINECLDTSWIGQGGFVDKFENEFSKYVDCKYGITTTSGTTALHLPLVACGIKMVMKY